MLVNSVTNFNYGQSRLAHKAVTPSQTEEKPIENQGITASLYFSGRKDNGNSMKNATLAGLGSLMLLTATPALTTSCEKDDTWAKSESISKSESNSSAYANDTAIFNFSTHGKGCHCDTCCAGRDTVYIKEPGETKYIYLPGDTVKLPGDTVKIPVEIPVVVYVDTGSYHVTHDTITKWKDNYQKPIPLDTLAKINDKYDIDGMTPQRKNIVNYQAIREWEYGQRFVAEMNQLESSKNVLVYDREDLDWLGHHKGWGKDVYRIPTSRFTIQTYSGKKLNSPKGVFFETYVNPWDEKTSIYDNNLVQRYFFQTVGDSVKVFSYDPHTGLYREDGRVGKGYLDKGSVGSNILLKDLIASDPAIKWGTDPDYSTEDHLVGVKVVTVNDEELKLMYLRARDDEYAEQHYGVANN